MFGEYRCGAKTFSEITGIHVYDDWGMSNQALIQRVYLNSHKEHDHEFVEQLYDQFDLPKAKDHMDKYHAVMGVISQYNRDDIEFFMTYDFHQRSTEYQMWCRSVEARTTQMFWIPSPKTLLKIERELARGKFQHSVFDHGHQYSMG